MTDVYRTPPPQVVEKGASLERDGAVRSAVFQVETRGERFIVYEEHTAGGTDLACTCPTHRTCEHVAAVLAHVSRRLATEETSDRARSSWPSYSSLTMPPPPPVDTESASLCEDRDRARRIHDGLCEALEAIAGSGIGSALLRSSMKKLETDLEGVAVPDIVRTASALRTAALSGEEDTARLAALLERVRGVVRVLRSFLQAQGPGARLEGSFLGRSWAFEESERTEDAQLLEVARSSVLTPFGLRRNKAYYLDLLTGKVYTEMSHERPGMARTPSVGPFPRRIHAGLMMIMPGIPPVPIRLLQYVILPPPGENDLLRLKKASVPTAREVCAAVRRAIAMVQSPYPTFVAFSPARVLVSGGRAALEDGEGAFLRLAHDSNPHVCRALAAIAARSTIHCVTGMMHWTGRDMALDPLSVLFEHPRGLSLLRLR